MKYLLLAICMLFIAGCVVIERPVTGAELNHQIPSQQMKDEVAVPLEGSEYFYLESTGSGYELGEMPERYEGVPAKIIPV